MSQEPIAGQVVVGVIKGASGLEGAVKIEPHTDVPDRFSSGSHLWIDGRRVIVKRSRHQKNYLVVKFDAIHDRNEAELLFGQLVTVTAEQIPCLPTNHFYHFQLLDMAIYKEDCIYLGSLSEIITTPGNDVYVVKKTGFRDLLLPALSNVILDVDVPEKFMVVRLLEGLEQVVMKNPKRKHSAKRRHLNAADSNRLGTGLTRAS